MRTARALLALFLVIGCGGPAPGTDAGTPDPSDAGHLTPPVVDTASGPVQGRRGDGFLAFLGIPYAAPPVGDLRWRAPEPPEPWTEPLDTTRAPPRCVQDTLGFSLPSQEDCLYLNVHTPDPRPENAPVMVWIHGGGFVFGEGLQTDGGTAGDLLASQHGLVVVSMNYRLGPFGFLAHPALDGDAQSGNYGFADQIAALEWVQANIAAFGGDPSNVTIVGESAGGISVCAHLVSPASEGLFARAITESGLCDTPYLLPADAEAEGMAFASRVGCDGASDVAQCLREASVDALQTADQASSEVFTDVGTRQVWTLIADGGLLPGDFRAEVEAGAFHRVPTIVGWNGDEGTLFVMLAEQAGTTVDAATYPDAIAQLADAFGVSADAVLAQYPLDAYPDAGAAFAAALGHAALACPSRRAAELLAGTGADVRVYRFTYPDAKFQLSPTRDLGAFHSAEIQYVFGHPASIGQTSFRGDDVALHEAMAGYWARFVTSGDPNGDGAPEWPAYDVTGDANLVLDRAVTTESGADRSACALWAP